MNDGYLDGMQSFDRELERMVRSNLVDEKTAISYATNPNNLALTLTGLGSDHVAGTPETEEAPKPPVAAKPSVGVTQTPKASAKEEKPDWLE